MTDFPSQQITTAIGETQFTPVSATHVRCEPRIKWDINRVEYGGVVWIVKMPDGSWGCNLNNRPMLHRANFKDATLSANNKASVTLAAAWREFAISDDGKQSLVSAEITTLKMDLARVEGKIDDKREEIRTLETEQREIQHKLTFAHAPESATA